MPASSRRRCAGGLGCQLVGEVTGVSRSKAQAYFELRDAEGAVPCAIWLNDLEQRRAARAGPARRRGSRDLRRTRLLPGRRPGLAELLPSAPPSVRLAGEGDLLARLEALRKQLLAEGLFELQKQLARPLLPKTIGVVTAEGGAARRDLLAGLRRRGWAGTIVWAFAPVQDRRAAPAIAGAIQDLAARPEIEAILVTRGGGSLADLWAFCDETLCRTVAMLRVPVISAVGHERDSTLIDDVAAVACSTPTHAAEAVVPLDCVARPRASSSAAAALRRAGERAVGRPHPPPRRARPRARHGRCDGSGSRSTRRRGRSAPPRNVAPGERRAFQRRIAVVVLHRAPGGRPAPKRSAAATRCAGPWSPSAPTTPSAPWSAATPWPRTPTGSR